MSHAHEIEAIERISQALFQSIELDELLETALRTALEEVGAESGSILLAAPETKALVFRCSIGERPVPRGTSIPWDRGIAGSVFQTNQPALIRDVKANPLHYPRVDEDVGHATRDMITVPIKQWRGEPIGVMNVLNKRTGLLDEHDLRLLTIVSAFTALALQQSRLFEDAKLAEVARIAGNIGHDLKNLLTPVISSVGLLKEELDEAFAHLDTSGWGRVDDSRALCVEAIGLIQRTSKRIHHRVKEIADCVKGRSTPPVFSPCSLERLVDDVLGTLSPLAVERGIIISATGFEATPMITADERGLYSALYNLAINAIAEVEREGSVQISGAHEPDSSSVAISVRDDGRGMTPEMRDALLAGNAPSRKRDGTGLGMRIVKDVVETHRGALEIESELGGGTTIRIRLPVTP
jgi:signal transduction histidine kinase